MKADSSKLNTDDLTGEFIKLTHDYTGITIKHEKRTMLEGRLRRRVRDLKLEDLNAYLLHVKQQPTEKEHFINAVTTNETYFYRTPRIWEYILNQFLPDWNASAGGRSLSVWSAASSTGEEAHTLGVVLQNFKDTNAGFDYRVKGTDIDSSVVEKARLGIYKGRAVERFRQTKPELFGKYMIGDDVAGYRVLPDIKTRLDFSTLNLFDQDRATVKHDLVLLRNVLIYFVKDDQVNVMAAVHKRLNIGGVAIIGESESLNHVQSDFVPLAPTIYQAVPKADERKAA